MILIRHQPLILALLAAAHTLATPSLSAQARRMPGHSIGSVTIERNLILLELDSGVVVPPNLFDLAHATIRFTPDTAGYRVQNLSERWDVQLGDTLGDGPVTLRDFSFPFSGKSWDTLTVGRTGTITFGNRTGRTQDDGGLTVGRFAELREAAGTLVDGTPGIAVFLKPRMSGVRYVKQLADRVVVTWNLTEPHGGIFDFTWKPTTNWFQAVLRRDGTIDLTYGEMSAKDAIVGIYPRLDSSAVRLSGIGSAVRDLSALGPGDGPFPVLYEAFHWAGPPRTVDLTCTVIGALGDHFDFFAWYSDFRLDTQEAGTPSTGPRGGNVTGINEPSRSGAPYCSEKRLQWMFVQPVYIGSDQGQERSPDGSMTDYDYAVSQIGHELGHRWTADALAVIDGDTVDLGPTHWTRGLQAPAAFPYRRPVEASAMGGGVWQDNHDGTYTQLDDDFFVPATGYSYLDLYLMGLVPPSEVPDFFLLTHLLQVGGDDRGRPVFGADEKAVTIQDVIAANGPRQPDSEHSQKHFRTGIVAVTLHGKRPSPELVRRANAIGDHWVGYWEKVTGHRATMTTVPKGE